MDESAVSEEEVEKLVKDEEVAREKMQEALRRLSPESPEEPASEVTPAKDTKDTPEKDPVKESEKEKKTTHETKNESSIPGVSIHKTSDKNTLIDVHVNNPMKRIIELLEDIKKQKAFSFTIRGSLGIMGVILTLSVFGFFGGGKILCDKGLQTRTGTLRMLSVTEEYTDPSVPWSKAMLLKLFGVSKPITRSRVVLIAENEPPVHLITTLKQKPEALNGVEVIATGNYNSCSATLSVSNEQSLQQK